MKQAIRPANISMDFRHCHKCNKWLFPNMFYSDGDRPARQCKKCDYKRRVGTAYSRNKQKRHRERYPHKIEARRIVNQAVRNGVLVRPESCENCCVKVKEIHGHHADYSKPLSVRWVCEPCHQKIHSA